MVPDHVRTKIFRKNARLALIALQNRSGFPIADHGQPEYYGGRLRKKKVKKPLAEDGKSRETAPLRQNIT
jgi:hypothetical protein